MARNKSKFKSPSKVSTNPVSNAKVHPHITNGLADAIGFGQNPFGGGASLQPVSDSATAFENLRWYLVSNLRQLLSELYAEIGLVQTIVNVPVDDALRGGVMFKSKQLDESQIKELALEITREDALGTIGWGAKWTRLYGGGGLLVLIDDQDPELPLDLAAINKDTKVTLRAADMWELQGDKQSAEDFASDVYTVEEFYRYYFENVHKSRVIAFKGLEAPAFIRPRLRGWGLSCCEALIRSLNQYLKATDLGFEVLDEFKLDVYKMKNLVDTLLSPNGTTKVKERIQMANWQKNYQNAIVMDSEDDFDHKQLSFSGLAEAMTGIRMQVAADMRMPITKLFGTSVASGFQTDQNDMENYNSMVESEVRVKIQNAVLFVGQIKCQQLFGMIPDDLEFEFKPLRELTAIDQENVKTQKFTRLLQAKAAGELTTQEFRDAANKGNLFDIQLDTGEDGINPDDPQLEGVLEGKQEEDSEPDDADEKEDQKDDDTKAKTENMLPIFNAFDHMKRFFNSPEFDRASYEADGGDDWINPGRREIFDNPMNVDKGLWAKSKQASLASFGEVKWQFVVWFYRKNGGKF